MPQNGTRESEAYCSDVNCYCRKQEQQETISKEANHVNGVNGESIEINKSLGFFGTNSVNNNIFARDELHSGLSTMQWSQRRTQQ